MMRALRSLLVALLLTGLLYAVSYKSKTYLSSSEASIVREFINPEFALKMAKLLFMNNNVAGSQYYQFLAITYCSKLSMPHYHIIEESSGKDHDHGRGDEDGHDHESLPSANEKGEKYVAFTHGHFGEDVPLTQRQVDDMKARTRYVSQHVSEFIDSRYFYSLVDLSNALDDDNEYVLMYGKGWILNVDMADRMIEVYSNSFKRNPAWRKMFDAGWIALYYTRDYEKARRYLTMAQQFKGAPGFVTNILNYSFYMDRKYEQAIMQIMEEIKQTENHSLKVMLEKKLEWYSHLLVMNRAAKKYREVNGRDIQKLEDLVAAGLIKKIPDDEIGGGFAWDGKNAEVVSQNLYDLVKVSGS